MKMKVKTDKFFTGSPDALEDTKILELLMQYCTDEPEVMAQRLLTHYPTIADLLEAEKQDLQIIEGMDKAGVLLLRLVTEMHRRYFLSRNPPASILTCPADYGRYLLPYFYAARNETVYLLMLDAACTVINCRMIGSGSVNSANVPIRRLVQEAIAANATGIVLAHNHPSGITMPSREDVEITLRLQDTLALLEINLLDHIIVADDTYISLRECGYLYR